MTRLWFSIDESKKVFFFKIFSHASITTLTSTSTCLFLSFIPMKLPWRSTCAYYFIAFSTHCSLRKTSGNNWRSVGVSRLLCGGFTNTYNPLCTTNDFFGPVPNHRFTIGVNKSCVHFRLRTHNAAWTKIKIVSVKKYFPVDSTASLYIYKNMINT